MNKKLGKKLIFLAFEFFANSWTASREKDKMWDWRGFKEGCKLQMEKYGPYSVLLWRKKKKKKSPTWVNLAWPGLVWSTACGCSLGRQMRGRWQDGLLIGSSYPPTTPPPRLLVKFQQQHDCIISSTYVTEQGSVSSKVSWDSVWLCSFWIYFQFFFSFKKNKDELILEMFLRKPAWKREPRPRGQFKELPSGAPLLFRGPLLHRLHP